MNIPIPHHRPTGRIRTIALVGFTALACGTASAQSTVRVHGLLDTSISVVDTPTTRIARLNSGDLQTSRLGFEASEDLGGGNRVNVSLLGSVGADTGAANLFALGSSIGLSGPWGSFDAGFLRNSMIFVGFATDLAGYGLSNYASTATLHHHGITGSGIGGFFANTLRYRTPEWKGWKAEIAHSLGDDSTALLKNGEFTAGNIQYRSGPIYLGLGMTQTRTKSATSDYKYDGFILGGTYDFGLFKLGGHYLRTDRPGLRQTGNLLNAKLRLTARDDIDLQTASLKEPGGKLARTLSIGYSHHLSKRTDLYAYALVLRNNTAGTRSLWYFGQPAVAPGGDSSVAGIGIRHAF